MDVVPAEDVEDGEAPDHDQRDVDQEQEERVPEVHRTSPSWGSGRSAAEEALLLARELGLVEDAAGAQLAEAGGARGGDPRPRAPAAEGRPRPGSERNLPPLGVRELARGLAPEDFEPGAALAVSSVTVTQLRVAGVGDHASNSRMTRRARPRRLPDPSDRARATAAWPWHAGPSPAIHAPMQADDADEEIDGSPSPSGSVAIHHTCGRAGRTESSA